MNRTAADIALARLGVGARPGERESIAGDPQAWVLGQARSPAAFQISANGLASTAEAIAALRTFNAERKILRDRSQKKGDAAEVLSDRQKTLRAIYDAERAARVRQGASTLNGFAERLVWFWSNHFCISDKGPRTRIVTGAFEREVIRANMSGSFASLQRAVMRHPAMLSSLDQARSVGPNSPAGMKRDVGLNENLAREALELHSLGVNGGYTQKDVTELARALTGWTVPLDGSASANSPNFRFAANFHEPGTRTFLGKTYPDTGEEQAGAMLAAMARHPSTARFIATKLARHFIADVPPAGAIDRIEKVFLDTDGDLPSLHAAIASLPEVWSAPASKIKAPFDFVISALRAANVKEIEPRSIQMTFSELGGGPFEAGTPDGWPDDAASWISPDAVMKRLNWSIQLADRLGPSITALSFGETALGVAFDTDLRQSIQRAASRQQGAVLVLMSPAFQRR